MKAKILLISVICLAFFAGCNSSDDDISYVAPKINNVIKSDWTDTITTGEFKDWITLLGDNFVDVKSIYVNDVEIVLEDTYVKKTEITFQIPDAIPEKITNTITVKTEGGTATIPFIVNIPAPIVVPARSASWLFDDSSNLLKADVGEALSTGWRENVSPKVTHIPSPNGMTGFSSIDGPEVQAKNKAVNVDKWYFFLANHGINPNRGGTRVNEYTIMIDFRVPVLGVWYTFLQTDPYNNDSDGEIFINKSGAIGSSVTGYSSSGVTVNKWQRLVVSVKLGDKGWINYYLNGNQVLGVTDMSKFPIDVARYSLDSKFVLFGDNDGDDAAIDIAEVATWNVALNADQVTKLEEQMNKR
jgi:hypothetical protein